MAPRFLVVGLLLVAVAGKTAVSDVAGSVIAAAKARDETAIRSLLTKKADVNERDSDGSTALHWAVHLDEPAIAELLVSADADAGTANAFGVRPLLLACVNGSAATVRLLLRAGADPNTASPEGETALMTCSRTGNSDAVAALLDGGAEVNRKEDWRGQSALMWAAAEGHVDAIRELVAAGADLSARSEGGFTALLFAVRQGQKQAVEALVEAGADPNEALPPSQRTGAWAESPESGATGRKALDLAVENAHYEIAALLLEAGADPNTEGQGWTPLHTISWVRKPGTGSNDPAPEGSGSMSSIEIVKLLAEHGADINAPMQVRRSVGRSSLNTWGATPFLLAARTADAELMRLLVDLGADPLQPNADGSTPVMVAAGLGVRAPGEDAGTEPEVLEAVQLALELGGDVNAIDKNGETAMHGAAYKHLPKVVRLLHESGAGIDAWNRKNEKGWTPLRIAVGVHRGMNLRASPETAAVLREIMAAAGVSTEVDPEPIVSGATR